MSSISQLSHKGQKTLPFGVLLELQRLLRKSIFSRKFYQEINDKVLSKSSTVDANLYFICYFTLLTSSVLNNKPKIKHFLRTQIYNVARLINRFVQTLGFDDLKNLDKSISKYLHKPVYTSPKPDEVPSNLAVHLKAISSYLSDVRIFNRLTEAIKYAPWIIDEYSAFINPAAQTPKLDRFINLFQSLNCLVLELLENAGWLTDHNWVGTNDNNYWCIETYIWCSRVWAAYVVIEIIELIRRTPISGWDKNWRINLFKQAIQIPLVVHWSLYEGCLSPFWVGLCGSGASWWAFKDMWSSIDLS